jgi:hypothetical protein
MVRLGMGKRWRTITALWVGLCPSIALAEAESPDDAGIGTVLKSLDDTITLIARLVQVTFRSIVPRESPA